MSPRVALVLSLVFFSGCENQAPGTPSAPFLGSAVTVSGYVLDFSTGSGVGAARVEFGDLGNPITSTVVAVTDATGLYRISLPSFVQMPSLQPWYVAVDGVFAGAARPTVVGYRGDLFTRSGTCVSRYGVVSDARTLRPLPGATVSLLGTNVTTGTDGWYRIDLGCPANGLVGFNTTFIYVSHPDYANYTQPVGRGVFGVDRIDVWLEPQG